MAKFLYMDNHPMFRDVLSGTGKDLGIEVVVVSTPARAIRALANQGPFDVVISDYGGKPGGILNHEEARAAELLSHIRAQNIQVPFFIFSNWPPHQILEGLKCHGLDLPEDRIVGKLKKPHDDFLRELRDRFCPPAPVATQKRSSAAGKTPR